MVSPSPNRYFLFTTSVAVQAGVMVTVQCQELLHAHSLRPRIPCHILRWPSGILALLAHHRQPIGNRKPEVLHTHSEPHWQVEMGLASLLVPCM